MRTWIGCGILALTMVACRAPQRPGVKYPAPPTGNPRPTPGTVNDLAAAIASDAERSDREADSRTRGQLADDASRDAEACLAQAPQAAACLYGQGLALGLEAKAHPTRAGELLKSMLESLSSAESADPTYDQAGPARVRGLVLVRAPGWPLGPGDAEAGLVAARSAAALRPQYPPNLLALAEALAKNGNQEDARENYERAREAAQALPPSPDRDGWLRQADEALKRK